MMFVEVEALTEILCFTECNLRVNKISLDKLYHPLSAENENPPFLQPCTLCQLLPFLFTIFTV